MLLFPILLLPVLLLAVGVSWFLAAWGVFIKDMNQIVPLFVQMTRFMSSIFYPASAVPAALRPVWIGSAWARAVVQVTVHKQREQSWISVAHPPPGRAVDVLRLSTRPLPSFTCF